MVDIMLYVSYVLIGIAVVGSIILPLIKSLDDPASLVKSALGVVGIVAVFLIAYMLSGSEVSADVAQRYGTTESTSKLVGASLISMYLMGAIAIGSILFSEVAKLFK
jgi:hypothetical protein